MRYLVAYEGRPHARRAVRCAAGCARYPVSPELLPPKDGEISQKTEELVGPYELHDFFLYYMVRFGYSPRKIFRVARLAFQGTYDDETIKKWLVIFTAASSSSSSSVPACRTVRRSDPSQYRREEICVCQAMPACVCGRESLKSYKIT